MLFLALLLRWPSFFPEVSKNEAFITSSKRQIDLNHCSPLWLTVLPEVGAKRAQMIVDARPFHQIQDVIDLRGISERHLKIWAPYLLPITLTKLK